MTRILRGLFATDVLARPDVSQEQLALANWEEGYPLRGNEHSQIM